MPVRITWQGEQPWVRCYDLGDVPFVEPFFGDTVTWVLDQKLRAMLDEPLDMFLGRQPSCKSKLRGLIYHVSRCGSTLVSQMLAALPQTLVLSEPEPIHDLLNPPPGVAVDWSLQHHRLRLLAQCMTSGHEVEQAFLKLDPSHILQHAQIEQALGEIPWIFLYRDPLEVFMSHVRLKGKQMIPAALGAERYGLSLLESVMLGPELYMEQVLFSLYQAGLEATVACPERRVNYTQLPAFVIEELPRLWGLEISPDLMMAASRRNAKRPAEVFESDGLSKRAQATAKQIQLCAGRLAEVFRALEAFRAGGS